MTQSESIIQYLDTSWRNDVEERILKQLEQRGQVEDIDFGRMLADALNSGPGQFVFVRGQFWCYCSDTGLYEQFDDVELCKLLYDLHDAKGHDRTRHKLTKPKIDRVVKIASDLLNDSLFFEDVPQGVATKDGFLLLDEGKVELKNHDARHRARWKVPAGFSPLVDTEETKKYLATILGGSENAQTLLEVLGATLFGLGYRFGRMLVLVGDGANGKSTIVEIMRFMIPASMRASVPLDAVATEYDRVELVGKILNTCEEFPPLSKIDVQAVKNIITGGEIQARYVRGNAFTMKPIAQHVICTNQLPPLHENNEALRRRLIVIRLNRIIPVEQRDLDFAQKFFNTHGDALLVLATRALEDALKRGRLYEPSASAREVDRWLSHSDCVGSFLKEHIEQTGNPKDRIGATELYGACVNYAKQEDFTPPTSLRAFKTRLLADGFEMTKSSKMEWVGVQFREAGED